MPPNSDKQRVKQSLDFKYPTYRDSKLKSPTLWLEGKVIDDNAEGLWRVHDNLYDVSDFVSAHPGGSMWLNITKGTDITEAFEAHHISSLPEEMLENYFARKAAKPRNSPFTFDDDGFYRTLKRNVKAALKDVPKNSANISNLITDVLCTSTFICSVLACKFDSVLFAIASSFCLTFTTIAAHNYFHKKDNFRMYYFNLSMMDFREWRIAHALSHHLYPNTVTDLEISAWEPVIQYLPNKKSFAVKYGSYILVFVLWPTLLITSYYGRITQASRSKFSLDAIDAIPFTIPLAMVLFSGASLFNVIVMWICIILLTSFIAAGIGFSSAHHHPDIFHEGDAPRAKTGIDWGIHQIDAVADRYEITDNTFLVLTIFGDHALHHLFPTLDHSTLKYLKPTFKNTMQKFGVNLLMKSQIEMVVGAFKQLSIETPNLISPGCK